MIWFAIKNSNWSCLGLHRSLDKIYNHPLVILFHNFCNTYYEILNLLYRSNTNWHRLVCKINKNLSVIYLKFVKCIQVFFYIFFYIFLRRYRKGLTAIRIKSHIELFLRHSKKKGVKRSWLLFRGIAKRLYTYNHEAHTVRWEHPLLLLMCIRKFGDFRNTSSKSKHFPISYVKLNNYFCFFIIDFNLLIIFTHANIQHIFNIQTIQ